MDEFDYSDSTRAFMDIEDPAEAQRYYADAANIQQRLNDNPNLGPEPFELVQQGGPEFYVEWRNDRFEVVLYGRDFMEDEDIVYSLEINTIGEQEPEFLERAREIVTAIRNPLQGARRRRRNRRKTKKTKKASKKRRSTKRRV